MAAAEAAPYRYLLCGFLGMALSRDTVALVTLASCFVLWQFGPREGPGHRVGAQEGLIAFLKLAVCGARSVLGPYTSVFFPEK